MTEHEQELYNRMLRLRWGWHKYWGVDPDQAIGMLEEASKIAEQLQKPLIVMECRHWITQLLLFQKRDFAKSLPMAIESAVEARKPLYQNWQHKTCLHQDLIASYVGADAISYEAAIEKALSQMLADVSPTSPCMSCLLGERVGFEYKRGDTKAAERAAQAWFAHDNGSHHGSAAQECLTEYAVLHQEYEKALEHGELALKLATKGDRQEIAAGALAWQAVAHLHLGDEAAAETCSQQCDATLVDYHATLSESYHNARVTYHELRDKLPDAIAARAAHLVDLADHGALREEARAWVDLCRLKKQYGQLNDITIEQAQASIAKLKIQGDLPEKLAAIIS